MRPLLLALLLTACGSQDPVATPSKPDVGVDAHAPADVPCGGTCGAGTACENGQCRVAGMDAGATHEDQHTADMGMDAGAMDEVAAPNDDVPLDVSHDRGPCTSHASCPPIAHALVVCVAGGCLFSRCADGWGNCDGNTANGCEVNIVGDLANCGECGRRCPPDDPGRPSLVNICSGGGCSRRCAAEFDNCDRTLDNGCEYLGSTPNCGACGVRCDPSRSCTVTDGGFACL